MKDEDQYIIFYLDREEFGIQILKAHEIVMMKQITKLPQSSSFIEGVINLRGELIIVVDLRKRFNLLSKISSETRIMIIEIDGVKTGLMVDSICEVLRIKGENISHPPKDITQENGDIIAGIGMFDDRLIILLEIHEIFSKKQLKELKSIREEVKL